MSSFLDRLQLDRRGFIAFSAASACAAVGEAQLFAEEKPSDAVPSIGARMAALEEAAPLSMQFRGKSADEARRWQAEFAAKLSELLGPFQPPITWQCALEKRVELATHVREERLLTATGVAPVPFHLLLPRTDANAKSTKRAGILAIHGHGVFGHDSIAGMEDSPERKAEIEKFKYDYGLKLVERGYVVVAPCLTPFGRRLGTEKVKRGDPCTLVNLQLQHLGKLLIAENLRDCLWTLDYLAKHEAVDERRLGCVGLSYGGRMTTLTAALDPRVCVAVIGGAMNTFQERAMVGSTAGCQVIPGLLNYGDLPEVASLIAPRRCVWTNGEKDGLLIPEWIERFRERQGRVYAALGATEQVAVDSFAGGHEWHGDVAYPILEKVLQWDETLFFDDLTTSFSREWHLNHGEWKIVDGGFRGSEDEAENHAAAARYRTGVLFTDCVFEFDFRLDGAKMISLSINDFARHLCHARVRTNDVQVQKDDTDKAGPDKATVIATTKMKVTPGQWHHLKVSIVGDTMTVDVDGTAAVGKHGQFAEPKENFALIVAGDSASFRDFRMMIPNQSLLR